MLNSNLPAAKPNCINNRNRRRRKAGGMIESCEPRLHLTTAPAAVLSATDVNATSSTPVILIAAYTDPNAGGITGISGAASAISITGRTTDTTPIARGLAAQLNAAPTFTGSAAATETYTIDAPAGGWTAADNGTYFLSLSGEDVLQGSAQTPVTVGTAFQVFYISILGASKPATPAVSLAAGGSITSPTTPETVTATYADGDGITSIVPGAIQISDPGGSAAGTLTAVMNTPGSLAGSPTSTQESYSVSPPAGGWTSADDGTYTVSLAAGTVSGVADYETSSSFDVNIGSASPTATLNAALTASLPSSVIGGQKSKAAATVVLSNPNATLFTGPVTITLYVSPTGSVSDGTVLTSIKKTLKLKPQKAAKFKLKIPSFPDVNGTYTLVAGVSVDGSVISAVGPSTLIAPPTITFTPPTPVTIPATVPADGKLTVEFTLHNTGNVLASGAAPLTISLSTLPDGSNATSISTQRLKARLKPGQSKVYKFKLKLPASVTAGAYYTAVSLNVQSLGDENPADGSGVSGQAVTVG